MKITSAPGTTGKAGACIQYSKRKKKASKAIKQVSSMRSQKLSRMGVGRKLISYERKLTNCSNEEALKALFQEVHDEYNSLDSPAQDSPLDQDTINLIEFYKEELANLITLIENRAVSRINSGIKSLQSSLKSFRKILKEHPPTKNEKCFGMNNMAILIATRLQIAPCYDQLLNFSQLTDSFDLPTGKLNKLISDYELLVDEFQKVLGPEYEQTSAHEYN